MDFSLNSKGRIITTSSIHTPIGPMMIGVSDEGLHLLEFEDRKLLDAQLESLTKRTNVELITGNHPLIDKVSNQLTEYFNGIRKNFDLPLLITGTEFQQKAWNALLDIPFGVTRSYKQQAHAICDINAVRAVARANGENRIAIVIPCHRIIGSDGSIVGYGGGIRRKQWLLKHEFENQ